MASIPASQLGPQMKLDAIDDVAWGPYMDFLNEGDPSIPFPVEPLDHRTLHTVAQLEGATVQLGSAGFAAQKRALDLEGFDSDSDTDEARATGKRGAIPTASKKACREKARREKLNEK